MASGPGRGIAALIEVRENAASRRLEVQRMRQAANEAEQRRQLEVSKMQADDARHKADLEARLLESERVRKADQAENALTRAARATELSANLRNSEADRAANLGIRREELGARTDLQQGLWAREDQARARQSAAAGALGSIDVGGGRLLSIQGLTDAGVDVAGMMRAFYEASKINNLGKARLAKAGVESGNGTGVTVTVPTDAEDSLLD